jgi:hypothetical protein
MKGLSQVGEEAIKEYLEVRYPKKTKLIIRRISDEECHMVDVAEEDPTESSKIQSTVPV